MSTKFNINIGILKGGNHRDSTDKNNYGKINHTKGQYIFKGNNKKIIMDILKSKNQWKEVKLPNTKMVP